MNPGIDPHFHIWGWEIPGYLFLGGVVAGIMVLLALMELRGSRPRSLSAQLMPFVGVGLLSLGMLFLFLDLEHPLHVLRFYGAFRPTSPMSWGSWLLLLVYPALILMGLGGLDAARREWLDSKVPAPLRGPVAMGLRWADAARKPVLWGTVLLGVGLGIYTGMLLGTLVARPMWNSSVLGPLFLVSGVSTGAALMMLTRLESEEAHTLVRWDSAAIAAELVLIVVLAVGYLSGNEVSNAAGALIFGGPYTAVFWGLVVVGGLVVPLALNILEMRRHIAGTRFAPALILIGGLALRAIFVVAGQTISFSHLG